MRHLLPAQLGGAGLVIGNVFCAMIRRAIVASRGLAKGK